MAEADEVFASESGVPVSVSGPVDTVAIVPNWRQPGPTAQVVKDLLECGCDGFAVVVVDDGSADGFPEGAPDPLVELRDACHAVTRAAGAGSAAVELVELPANQGYCAAVNAGLARARELGAEFVLLLNNDVRLPAGFLDVLRDCLRADPGLAGVGPTIVTPDGLCWSQGGDVGWRPNLVRLRGQGGPPAPLDAGPEAVQFLPGACALYRLESLGDAGLDESYWMYWEDVDLGDRLRQAGAKLAWLPWVRIEHEVSLSTGGGRSPLRKYASAVNTVRWLRQHGGLRHWLAFWTCDVLLLPLALAGGTPRRSLWAKVCGLRDGLLRRPLDRTALRRWV